MLRLNAHDLSEPQPSPWAAAARTLLRLLLLAGVVWLVHLSLDWASDLIKSLPAAQQVGARIGMTALALIVYALLLALPFVPGVEIGIMLLVLRGAEIALMVYLATLLGLVIAYLAGRHLPYNWLHRIFADLHLRPATRLLETLQPLNRHRRLALLRSRLPRRLGTIAVRYRYVAMALLFNAPGNSVIGGGGGIALIAGLSRLFTTRGMVITIALAVAPVPLGVWIWGQSVVEMVP